MIESSFLDMQINSLTDWIMKAGNALRGFYNPDKGVFWRNTFMIRKDQQMHPTSTNRSFFALYEYLRFLYEEDLKEEESWDGISSILKNVSEKYLSLLPDKQDDVRRSKTNEINMFTDSQLLISVSILKSLQRVVEIKQDVSKITQASKNIADENIEKLKKWKGGKVGLDDEVHHFVTLHIIRGLDSYFGWNSIQPPELANELANQVREDTLRLLAYHFAGVSSKYDPAELTFCVALLNRFSIPDAPLITERAIRSIVGSQSEDGAWPTPRYVSYEGRGMLHVSSYEIALTLTHLLSCRICEKDIKVCEIVLPALNRSFEMVKSNFNTVNGVMGWANDHTRRSGLIESWATATVLMFLINYRDALIELRQQLILQQYHSIYAVNPPALPPWPDMIPAFRQADWIDFNSLDSISDPTEGAALTNSLKVTVARPIGDDWVHRPQGTSLILYGPTGTRKTSLVIQLAKALRWPLLILSPSDFLRNGLEGFEATTAKIFDDLLRLRRTVVLLDECEEFFKARPKKQMLESRTVGAFITAGMLPRLQRLRDKKWVVFVLTTNSEPKELDEAVTRLGRFDYAQKIGYPSLDAQVRYVQKKMMNSAKTTESTKAALEEYEQKRKSNQQAEHISFSLLDKLVEKIKEMDKVPTAEEIRGLLQKGLVDQKRPPFLTDK